MDLRGFHNYDDPVVFEDAKKKVIDNHTQNFVVDFGKEEAQVAVDVTVETVRKLLEGNVPPSRPSRWINIWGPDAQPDMVNYLGRRYDFSPRLLAIMHTKSQGRQQQAEEEEEKKSRFCGRRQARESDVEDSAASPTSTSMDDYKGRSKSGALQSEMSHYTLAAQMINYVSIDFGTNYLCIGCNWMHGQQKISSDIGIDEEGEQKRLWSWLVLCDDHTVISLHEYPGEVKDVKDVKSMRANTLSVFSQLSDRGLVSGDPISMQTVRQALKQDVDESSMGLEGASLLFYYLFDDWRAVFFAVDMYSRRLAELRRMIIGDIGRKSISTSSVEIAPREIIPRLHVLGSHIRQAQHLYEGYKNLIQRALKELEPKSNVARHALLTPRTMSGLDQSPHQEAVLSLSRSARLRFERLSDRLELLMLSKTKELVEEKDALINTYFNINAQKDSEATARLTRSATLLAKLSVLFLPVSLMTSYFSVQISDLQGIYTAKDYWYTFAVLMSISFLFLFFFSRLLMWISENLDEKVRKMYVASAKYTKRKLSRKKMV